MTTNMQTLDELATAREQEHAAAADLRAGGPQYREAMSEEMEAARERARGMEQLRATGVDRTLNAARLTFQHRPAFDVSRDAGRSAAEARHAIDMALRWLTTATLDAVERVTPRTEDLACWTLAGNVQAGKLRLAQIVGPEAVRAVLDRIPEWEERLRQALTKTMDSRAGVVIAHRPLEQERAAVALDAWGDSRPA